MKPTSDQAYLLHIQDSIKQIHEYTKEGREVFFNSRLIQDAVIRNLEIIGEATKQLTSQLRAEQPSIPWKQIAGMRDMLIHDYFGVDLHIVWGVVEHRLPELEKLRGCYSRFLKAPNESAVSHLSRVCKIVTPPKHSPAKLCEFFHPLLSNFP